MNSRFARCPAWAGWLRHRRRADPRVARRQGQGSRSATRSREGRLACPLWRYYRDFDPNLASIRNEPEFKAIFADIERDMAQQRARLAARPKDAPLDLAATGR